MVRFLLVSRVLPCGTVGDGHDGSTHCPCHSRLRKITSWCSLRDPRSDRNKQVLSVRDTAQNSHCCVTLPFNSSLHNTYENESHYCLRLGLRVRYVVRCNSAKTAQESSNCTPKLLSPLNKKCTLQRKPWLWVLRFHWNKDKLTPCAHPFRKPCMKNIILLGICLTCICNLLGSPAWRHNTKIQEALQDKVNKDRHQKAVFCKSPFVSLSNCDKDRMNGWTNLAQCQLWCPYRLIRLTKSLSCSWLKHWASQNGCFWPNRPKLCLFISEPRFEWCWHHSTQNLNSCRLFVGKKKSSQLLVCFANRYKNAFCVLCCRQNWNRHQFHGG